MGCVTVTITDFILFEGSDTDLGGGERARRSLRGGVRDLARRSWLTELTAQLMAAGPGEGDRGRGASARLAAGLGSRD